MKKVFLLATVTALMCMGGSAVNAATVVHTVFMPSSYTDAYTTLSVARFNPTLGTLNSVKFDVNSLFSATVTASTSASTNQYLTWAIEDPTIQLNAPDSSTLINNTLGWITLVGTPTAPASGSARIRIPKLPLAPYSATQSLSGSGTQTITSGLSAYIGSGNVDLPFAATVPNFTLATLGGNNNTSMSTFASADLTVTYDYTPVPEPSSIITLLGGLGSLLAFRRRKA